MTTKHTCNGDRPPVFGRRTAGCARCTELAGGARPVEWASSRRARLDREHSDGVRAHFRTHVGGVCPHGPVCTYGEW